MSGSNGRKVPHIEPAVPGLDPRIHDALCDLHAYVLVLDAEWRRLGDRLEFLPDGGAGTPERSVLERRHVELTEELDALRGTIEKLRAYADPDGKYL